MKRKCQNCGKIFTAKRWNHIFCGSKINKTGCSWFNATVIRDKKRWKNSSHRKYQKEYGKQWKKTQRLLETDYAVRQLECKRQYYHRRGKETAKKWRKNNIDKILFWNKKRILAQKKVIGSHTWQEWCTLKSKHQNNCAICGISESELKGRWGNKFSKLTEDHVMPISKGGTDYIDNIQPLCISCNAKKKDK